MRKAIVILLFAVFAAVGLTCHSVVVNGQEKKEAASEKLGRWSGHIVRIDNENSFMDVRNPQGAVKRIYWDSQTTWSKLNQPVTDHSEFKEEARVICLGKAGEKGKFMAARIDLRVHP